MVMSYTFLALILFCTVMDLHGKSLSKRELASCSCQSYIEGTHECLCSEDSIVISSSPNAFKIDISCFPEFKWSGQDFPLIKLAKLNKVTFLECPFPNERFSKILKHLGANTTKALIFDYASASENVHAEYFENLPGLQELSLNNNGLRNIDEDAFKSLENLIDLSLKFNKINLTKDIFKNSHKLISLNLAGNELTRLPPALFANLTKLKVLDLWQNNLTSINATTFESVPNLILLELSRNQIQKLSVDAFKNLKKLERLSLSDNKLLVMPENIFIANEFLEEIHINRNPELRALPNGLFSNLRKLNAIYVMECKLNHLPGNLFQGSFNLQTVSLRMNELEFLPAGIFDNLKELRELDLGNNKIANLSNGIFTHTTELAELKLDNNFLSIIGNETYANLRNLNILNLENNKITHIDPTSFHGLYSLEHVFLGSNYINMEDGGIFLQTLPLITIDLSHNNISKMMVTEIKSLQRLDLSYNNIPHINLEDIESAPLQIEIDLRHNKISTINFTNIDRRIQRNTNWKSGIAKPVIKLDGNPFNCNCHMYNWAEYRNIISSIVIIKANDLKCKSPEHLEGVLVHDIKSSLLSCSFGQLKIEEEECPDKCQCSFRPWDKSLIVNCVEQNLTRAPELMFPNVKIHNQTEVNLQGNFLTAGPMENMGYENVTSLDLSRNHINHISWLPSRIGMLKLHYNNISRFNESVLTMMNSTTLTNLTLRHNPFICDCSATNLILFLKTNLAKKQIDTNNITCINHEKLLIHLDTDDVCLNHLALILGLSIGIALPALVMVITIAFYYCFQKSIDALIFDLLPFPPKPERNSAKIFDAFISYSQKDEEFVLKTLIPTLRRGPRPYKICLPTVEYVAGEFLITQIHESIGKSSSTLVVLSRNFIESEWGRMEFRKAHEHAVHERITRVILIIYADLHVEELDEELKAYVRTNTYVKWGDRWFWEKLRYVLPHSRVPEKKAEVQMSETSIN